MTVLPRPQTINRTDMHIITVSGLHSNIGKTLLSERIVSLVPGIAAIKISINDVHTIVTNTEQTIMEPGKDTQRLKTGGAGEVVWIKAKPEDIKDAVNQAMGLLSGYQTILIEGNSVLDILTPKLSFFVCDHQLLTHNAIKPSRLMALQKAQIIINNVRCNTDANESGIREKCRQFNTKAVFYSMNLKDQKDCCAILRDLINDHGL